MRDGFHGIKLHKDLSTWLTGLLTGLLSLIIIYL
ncbi:hypothetical protein V6Z12_A11G221100 [Gossypium hirsutum]